MDAFLMLACLGPFNAEETSRGREGCQRSRRQSEGDGLEISARD